jgi:hypothetical protein
MHDAAVQVRARFATKASRGGAGRPIGRRSDGGLVGRLRRGSVHVVPAPALTSAMNG